jgi:Outer membrane protein beta-barrel domain
MKKITISLLFFIVHFIVRAQDSTLVGRYGITGLANYSISNISEEKEKGGFGFELRYFPTPKGAFVLSFQDLFSSVTRFGKKSDASNYSLSGGFEKHMVFGNFSPYVGFGMGLNFSKIKSELILLPSNIKYFQNNLATYLIKPTIGLHYKINENFNAQLQANYNWTFSTDRLNTNPLFDDSYKAIYFGRKVATISIGVMYLFNE